MEDKINEALDEQPVPTIQEIKERLDSLTVYLKDIYTQLDQNTDLLIRVSKDIEELHSRTTYTNDLLEEVSEEITQLRSTEERQLVWLQKNK